MSNYAIELDEPLHHPRIRQLYSLDDQCWVCGATEDAEDSGYMQGGKVCKRCSTL